MLKDKQILIINKGKVVSKFIEPFGTSTHFDFSSDGFIIYKIKENSKTRRIFIKPLEKSVKQ